MHVIRIRNVHDALPAGLRYLAEVGQPLATRGGEAITAPEPVCTVYEEPCERVLFWPERDANPYFHFFEALWLLAGRRDVAFPAMFAKNMLNYSDDGQTLHGAYGHRWRVHWGHDQLDRVIDLLTAAPDSRRAVVAMWDPTSDQRSTETGKDLPCNTQLYFKSRLGRAGEPNRLEVMVTCRSNDIIWGCLAGDTLIKSPEGDLPIRKLALQFSLGRRRFPVYAVNLNTGEMALKWCNIAWKTGMKPVRELIFDDGTRLKLTNEHLLYLKKTKRGVSNTPACIEAIRAKDLKIGDRIWAPWYSKEGERVKFKLNILGSTAFSNMKVTSQAYEELLHGPLLNNSHVHHKDEDFTNDREDNLEGRMRSNHKIVEINELPSEDVYDFSVEDYHTALVGSGVLAHNSYGANSVHFSFVQEYVAGRLGLKVGKLNQISNDYHSYTDVFQKIYRGSLREGGDNPYAAGAVSPYPLMEDPAHWDRDLYYFLSKPLGRGFGNSFFYNVAQPLWVSHEAYRARDYNAAFEALEQCRARDWRRAAWEWLERRKEGAST